MFQPDKLAPLIEAKPASVEAPNPFTLESLIAWLRTKDGSYEFWDMNNCLICQYGRHVGVSENELYFFTRCIEPFEDAIGSKKISQIIAGGEETFEAALSRALAIQAGGK